MTGADAPGLLTMAVIDADGLIASVIVVEHHGSQVPGLELVPIPPDAPHPPGIGWRYERGAFIPPSAAADAAEGPEPDLESPE